MLGRFHFGLVNMLRLLGYALYSATLLASAKAKGVYEPMYQVSTTVSMAAKPTDKRSITKQNTTKQGRRLSSRHSQLIALVTMASST